MPDLRRAPKLLAVGDLHVENYGTWRDSEGRLSWGVNDFDEAFPMPYTNDQVRLATSVKILIDAEVMTLKFKDACEALLTGYREELREGGCPIVFAEQQAQIDKLGFAQIKPPLPFWEELNRHPAVNHGLPSSAKNALQQALPDPDLRHKVVRREAGVGSLGQERLVALAKWRGGFIAREAKLLTPSSCTWADGGSGKGQPYYSAIMGSAIRSCDPFQKVVENWLIRRLSPDSTPIHMEALPAKRDEERLVHAMGSETANVHLGTKRQIRRVLADLRRRKANWLRSAAKEMAKATEREWKEYKKL